MTDIHQNIGVIYEIATGRIVKSIRMAKRFRIEDYYSLKTGQAFLIGQRPVSANGFKVVDGAFEEVMNVSTSLDVLKKAGKEEIDRVAGIQRGEIGSHGYGQEMTYLAKEAQADAYLKEIQSGNTPAASGYPLPFAEVGITATTMQAVCEAIVAKANEWKMKAGAIEAARLSAKTAIEAAVSDVEIETIKAGIAWPP